MKPHNSPHPSPPSPSLHSHSPINPPSDSPLHHLLPSTELPSRQHILTSPTHSHRLITLSDQPVKPEPLIAQEETNPAHSDPALLLPGTAQSSEQQPIEPNRSSPSPSPPHSPKATTAPPHPESSQSYPAFTFARLKRTHFERGGISPLLLDPATNPNRELPRFERGGINPALLEPVRDADLTSAPDNRLEQYPLFRLPSAIATALRQGYQIGANTAKRDHHEMTVSRTPTRKPLVFSR